MGKKTEIRTEPVSLNESTLETNIVAEIAGLFNSPFNFGYPYRLRWLFEIDIINLNAFKKKTKLYRLTPKEENRGGGWDTKISIPRGRNENRGIFIQFKRGKHSDGNTIAGSIFNSSTKNPNPNAEFTFNDNKSKNPDYSNNQHQTLKNLADHLEKSGISPKSVMYGFPRITKLDDFENLEEDLLLHTSFLTIREIDTEAKNAKVNLYDRQVHHFRTCYIQENRREIASTVFQLNNSDEYKNENVLYEILLVKLCHIRNQLAREVRVTYFDVELLLMLADYLKVNPTTSIPLENFYPARIRKEIDKYFNKIVKDSNNNFRKIYGLNNTDGNPFAWRKRLFDRLVKFFNSIGNDHIDIQSDIPSEYTFNLKDKETIEFDLKTDYNIGLLVF
jgi:hypothetical protein